MAPTEILLSAYSMGAIVSGHNQQLFHSSQVYEAVSFFIANCIIVEKPLSRDCTPVGVLVDIGSQA